MVNGLRMVLTYSSRSVLYSNYITQFLLWKPSSFKSCSLYWQPFRCQFVLKPELAAAISHTAMQTSVHSGAKHVPKFDLHFTTCDLGSCNFFSTNLLFSSNSSLLTNSKSNSIIIATELFTWLIHTLHITCCMLNVKSTEMKQNTYFKSHFIVYYMLHI